MSLEDILANRETLESTRLESYLSDADFEQHFGCSKADFAGLAKWKRDAKKRALKLF